MRKDSSYLADAAKPHGGSGATVARIRSAYDGSRISVPCICLESEDRTRQAFRDECDINVLMKRYEKTGILPVGRQDVPQYADVSAIDFESSAQRVANVRGAFSMLDARTRARFENNPAVMLDFLADPANHAEAVKLGLIAQPKESDDGSGKAAAGVGSVGQAGESGASGGAAGRGAVEADRGAPRGAVERETGGAG